MRTKYWGMRGKNANGFWGRGVAPVLNARSGDSAYSKDVGVTTCQSRKSISLACGAAATRRQGPGASIKEDQAKPSKWIVKLLYPADVS